MARLFDRRDTDFVLFDVLKVQDLTRLPRFADHSEDVFRMILDAAEKLTHEEVAPTNVDGDRIGVKLVDGKVQVPESFKGAYRKYIEGGWFTLMEDYDVGGQQLPHSLGVAVEAMFDAANHSLQMLPGLSIGAVQMVKTFGTERQKKLYMEKMYSGDWSGTMCLTEPNAGSDVGNLTTVARRNPDGTYSIKGAKIFISWGEHEVCENIIHPVLARIEGDPAGTKGISIFLVPKYRVNEDGSMGEFNDVTCVGLEHKMGIHGSPTCQLNFGENDACVGELLGEERKGMKIMFQMMNTARLGVAVQGLSLAEPAWLYALEYAEERKQGSSMKEFKNPDAPRVSIMQHPDVRRMILDMQAKVQAMRALLLFTGHNADIASAGEGDEAALAQGVVELMTPIVKSWCTDIGFDVNETAIQVLGGHGFLADHPLEQYMRDAKIGSLYEGTNGIQAMDLLGRKIGMKGGLYLMQLAARIDETCGRAQADADLKDLGDLVSQARNALAETAMQLGATFAGGDLELPLLNAKPFLDAMSETLAGWALLEHALVAKAKLAALGGVDPRTNPDAAFLDGKIKTARYFISRTLPLSVGKFQIIRTSDRTPLEAVLSATEITTA
jgi:alkylation response protein AidB-like acyl-CoA dehydrogenase